ncbi:MAG: DUF2723 domain-containing protein [Thermomicrobia bacterium]|nr:DUF2723 domain-containing protein [Thermomicrobia bacterium]
MRLTAERRAAGTVGAGIGRRADAMIAAAFALLTVATRLPFRSHRAFNWDAVNFVLALHDYDVRLHHPQPPGYPVFVAMGRVLQVVIPDPNNALVAVAMLLSAGAVAALYLLGRTLFGQATGIIAALSLLCSVTFWTNGAVALAYPSLALFTTLVALLAWRCKQHAMRIPILLPLALSAVYAIGGGFRPDLLLFLLPLWLFGHWRLPWRTIVVTRQSTRAMRCTRSRCRPRARHSGSSRSGERCEMGAPPCASTFGCSGCGCRRCCFSMRGCISAIRDTSSRSYPRCC